MTSTPAVAAASHPGPANPVAAVRTAPTHGAADRAPRAGVEVTTLTHLLEALHAVDRQIASVIGLARQAQLDGVCEQVEGLPLQTWIGLAGRWTGTDRRMLLAAAETLAQMPHTWDAFDRAVLSWGQVRAIVVAARSLDAAERAVLDSLLARRTDELASFDPDVVLHAVDEHVGHLHARRAERREQRAIERSFLAAQPRLDGSASVYGEFDAELASTVFTALDDAADQPCADESPDAPSTRAQQWADALGRICASANAGGTDARPPRTELTVLVDLADARSALAGRLAWPLAGLLPTLTARTLEQLACDATLRVVLTHEGVPVAVGTGTSDITPRTRRAVQARDGGCRFPGCGAPIAWTDVHHIDERQDGGAHDATNLVCLCRRHHVLIHRRGWRLDLARDDGATLTVRRRGSTWTSKRRTRRILAVPRGDPPAPAT